MVPAQSGSQSLSFASDGGGRGGTAALGAAAAAAGLLELLLLVEGGDGGHSTLIYGIFWIANRNILFYYSFLKARRLIN